VISPLLDSLLDPKHVVLDLRGGTAGEAVWEIVERLRESGELRKAEEFFSAVMEREGKSSTVANGGVAFPHARTGLEGSEPRLGAAVLWRNDPEQRQDDEKARQSRGQGMHRITGGRRLAQCRSDQGRSRSVIPRSQGRNAT